MLVRESISFQRYKDPKVSLGVGKNSREARVYTFEKLKQEGIDFFFGGQTNDEERLEGYLNNIYEIKEACERLKDIVKIEYISSGFGIRINLKTWEVLHSNNVLFNCASEEDANFIIDICKKFAIDKQNFSVRKNQPFLVDLNEVNWFEDLVKNRIKYKKDIEEAIKSPAKNYNDK